MEIVTFLAIYVAHVPVCWKTFNYFNMTLVAAAMMTGFTYHLKKLAFALIAPFLISVLAVALIFKKDEKNQANAVTERVENTDLKEDPLEQWCKAQYYGDDPIVRRRLGLPPKPAGQY